ncbi:dynein axonemal assembly factor 4-like [Mercenaria mercenaria]|uniref:dynein axonemal assembly factor 4-like n=1 Tax=Mercenaria mercenaria TaxID=6596 RepID=UPI00234F3A42|nr:dynein axonemal assembly factor 4-like [Mercenaria mercenaria]
MPLIVKDFTWEQTDKVVFITVPLKGVKANKVDIFSSEEYLKVSYPPYLFECLLYAPVEDGDSVAQVGNGAVVFKLLKKEGDKWPQLQSDLAEDKSSMKAKREEAFAKAEEKAKERDRRKAEEKRANEKYVLNEIMKAEEEERSRIEKTKESERQQATQELEAWKEEQRLAAEKEKERLMEERRKEEAAEREKRKEQERIQRRQTRGKKASIFEENAEGAPKREVGKISVSFTHREFPTPERESVRPKEEEWLKKQAEARRIVELEDENLSEEEKNPMWLRDKGNEFFKAGNLEAAINAYSHALRLNHTLHSCLSNRAACHLKMRNFFKCIEDCSKALELLVPKVQQNADSRLKCHVRRGTALCQLEMYVEGLQDYEAALKLDPNNEQLRTDSEKIRHIIQTETVS